MSRYVTSQTPLRVSLSGGGTDFDAYSRNSGGAVLSFAINKYIYVSVKDSNPLFGKKFHISYSENEHVDNVSEIANGIVRESLQLLKIDNPIHISTAADIPASSGLGSSSSFAVGLLNALHAYKGEMVSPMQLAEEACKVEIERLGKPIGRQDQYAAAFGGCNHILFKKDGQIEVIPTQNISRVENLANNLVMIWTGISRSADEVLNDQNSKTGINREFLDRIRDDCFELFRRIESDEISIENLGNHLNNNWKLKSNLSALISNKSIQELYENCMASGSLGGKLLGAGAGGFFLNVVHASQLSSFQEKMKEYVQVQFKLSHSGSRVLLNITND